MFSDPLFIIPGIITGSIFLVILILFIPLVKKIIKALDIYIERTKNK